MTKAWFQGSCKLCEFPAVVAGYNGVAPEYEYCDYVWYCSNHQCENHLKKEGTGDMEWPEWLDRL